MIYQVINPLKRSRYNLFVRFSFTIHFNAIFHTYFPSYYYSIASFRFYYTKFERIKYFKEIFFNFVNIDLNIENIFHELFREIPL